MAYSRTHYGTGYYIYHQYVPGAPLSQPIRAWDGKIAAGSQTCWTSSHASGTDLVRRPVR